MTMTELPLERAQQLGDLLRAGRAWRESLITGTSTSSYSTMMQLLRALAALDTEVCEHPRFYRVFFPESAQRPSECAKCGQVVPDPEPDATGSAAPAPPAGR